MKIGIVYKSDSKRAEDLFSQIKDYLKIKGHELVGEKKLKEAKYILSLGGDGTLIHVSCEFAPLNIPFVGINTGNLGFLTAADADSWQEAVDKIIVGEVFVSERILLDAKVGSAKQNYTAINEVVVKSLYRVAELEVTVNGEEFLKIGGDGVILSTQTGSTAYSLSAGGPIVDPDLDCLLVTPINPIGLPVPSVVISPADVVQISINKGEDISLVIDGQEHTKLSAGQNVTITKGKYRVGFGYFSKNQFLKSLNDKFGLASRLVP